MSMFYSVKLLLVKMHVLVKYKSCSLARNLTMNG